MKKREEIADKYKWDISDYCKNNEDCLSELEIVQKQMQEITKFEGKLSEEDAIFESLIFCLNISRKLDKLIQYAYFKVSEDGNNNDSKELQEKAMSVAYEFASLSAFQTVEISELSTEFLTELMNNPQHSQFSNYFREIIRSRAHILSKDEEKLLVQMEQISENFSLTYKMITDIDFVFEPVMDSKGKKYELTYGTYGIYNKSADRTLRKNSAINFKKPFEKFNNTLASNYIGVVKSDCILSKIKKFESSLDCALFNEEISRKVFDNLINAVNNNLSIFHKYFELKRQKLKLRKMAIYDVNALTNYNFDIKISYDNAIQLIKKVVLPIGEEYVSLVQRAYDERWIDVFENKGKERGGYETSAYDAHPVILMNYKDNFDSVFTLIHELGHAMHSYYSNKNQPFEKASYSIFIAEIASIVNEVLLMLHFIENANSREEKIFYYDQFFHNFYATVNRQTMFVEFENIVHTLYEKTQVLSKDAINNIYLELIKKYFGKNVELLDSSKYEWSAIPHFYRAFYVYKYATGFISALLIAKKLFNKEEGSRESYIKFLSAGSSLPPLEVLKIAGVNLEDPRTFQEVFDFAEKILNNWK